MPSSYIEYMISLMSNYNSKNDEYNYDENIENICIEADNLIEENTRESTCRVKLKRILTTLNTCTCCKRHQTNRPSLIDVEKGHDGEYPDSDTSQSEKINYCICRCRHTSRWIVRNLYQ